MGPVDAIRSGFQRAVDLRGRSTRPEYWWWSLMTYVITLLVGDRPSTLEALALLALFVPSLAVTFRRLHDTDRSAWNLLWVLVPVLGVIACSCSWSRGARRHRTATARHLPARPARPDPPGGGMPLLHHPRHRRAERR